jgi:hypothetical protein
MAWQGNGVKGGGSGPFIFFNANHTQVCVDVNTAQDAGFAPAGCAACVSTDLARLKRLALLAWRRAPK